MSHIDETLLYEYLDEQLDAAEQARIKAHLAVCEVCQAHWQEARQLYSTLEALPDAPLMRDLSGQIVSRLAAERAPQAIPRWIRPVLIFQALAALFLFIYLWPSIQSFTIIPVGQILETAVQLRPDFSTGRLLEPLTTTLERLGEVGQSLGPDAPIPLIQGFLIIGLALIAWLVGNGLLLQNRERRTVNSEQ